MSEDSKSNTPSSRKSTISKPNRRSTFYRSNINESPVPNPNNSDSYNLRLKKEFEQLQKINHAIETSIDNVQNALEAQQQLAHHVDDTDRLLKVWSLILQKTEEYKDILEDPEWIKKQAA
ncbi:hypothetical protein BY458DRAFT_242161 [Sporodiniella umbellata]|nr:hypothetical protein BY458DRAFT_242161 [Sporodiniella umbellata]